MGPAKASKGVALVAQPWNWVHPSHGVAAQGTAALGKGTSDGGMRVAAVRRQSDPCRRPLLTAAKYQI